ncbi:MAG: methyltransferase domain-containing protein [Terriglobia bacterium]
MADIACPLCLNQGTILFAQTTDRLLETTNKTFSLRECRACSIIFLAPTPTEVELQSYYPAGYWWSEPNRTQYFFRTVGKRLESLYRKWALHGHIRFVNQAIHHVVKEGEAVNLLDVGCSGGTFLHELARQGIAVRGLDLSQEAVAHARRVYGLNCAVGDLTHSPWRDERFSLVTSFHVLEHVPDPRSFLRAARKALTERGRLVLQVPNIRSWQFHVFGAGWYGLDPPRHLVNFSDRALVRLLLETGYEVLRQKRFSLRDDAPAWVSSLFPSLDPLSRMAKHAREGKIRIPSSALGIFQNFVYFLLVLAAIPIALCDSLWGRGATLLIEARKYSNPSVDSAGITQETERNLSSQNGE